MDFYLTEVKANNKQGKKIHFPMNPEKVTLSSGIITQDYSIITLGEVRIPNGNKLDVISWEGKLPGESRSNMSYVKDWISPSDIITALEKFKKDGSTLKLLITETTINKDFFIEQFDSTWSGGHGDIDYSITLTEAKEIKIYSMSESNDKASSKSQSKKRATKPKPKTYTVKPGDSLWKIAQKELGNGSRYTEILKLSKPPLSNNPNKIKPGQVLTLPL